MNAQVDNESHCIPLAMYCYFASRQPIKFQPDSVKQDSISSLPLSKYQPQVIKEIKLRATVSATTPNQCSVTAHRMLSHSFIDNSHLAGQVALYSWPEVPSCSPPFLG